MVWNRLFIVAILTAAAAVLAACGGSESAESSNSVTSQANETTVTTSPPPSTTTSVATVTTAEVDVADAGTDTTVPAEVDPNCDWDSQRLAAGDASDEPAGEGSDLGQAILGSWQHTHIDEGSGFVALKPTTDIRFVLSSDRVLYCQDVEGATNQSENSAPLILEGDEIVLPSPATGYKVVAWNENTMVWLNHRDDPLYLLQRR